MALATDVITDSRLRQAIGGVGATEDTLLSAYRLSAIRWVENWTCRKILNVDDWRTDETDFYHFDQPDLLTFKVSDVRETDDAGIVNNLVVHYRNVDDDPTGRTNQTWEVRADADQVKIDRDAVFIYYDGSDSWGGMMRFDHPVPTLRCNRGMLAADIPPPFSDAVGLIVRALYDGTAYDELGRMTALDMLLKPYTINAYMRTVR